MSFFSPFLFPCVFFLTVNLKSGTVLKAAQYLPFLAIGMHNKGKKDYFVLQLTAVIGSRTSDAKQHGPKVQYQMIVLLSNSNSSTSDCHCWANLKLYDITWSPAGSNFVCQKLALKVANDDHVTVGHWDSQNYFEY